MVVISLKLFIAITLFFLLLANSAERKNPEQFCPRVSLPSIRPSLSGCDGILATISWVFVAIYIAILGNFWLKVCLKSVLKSRPISYLFAALISIKVCDLISFITCRGYESYDVANNILSIIHLLIVIYVLFSGCFILSEFISEVDRYLMGLSILIQILAYIANNMISTPPNELEAVQKMLIFVDLATCIFVLLWILSCISFAIWGEMVTSARGNARQLFILTIGYLFFTSLIKELSLDNGNCANLIRIKVVIETINIIYVTLFVGILKEIMVVAPVEDQVRIEVIHAN